MWGCVCVRVFVQGRAWAVELGVFSLLPTDGPANEAPSATCLMPSLGLCFLPPVLLAALSCFLPPSLPPDICPLWLVCGEEGVREELTCRAGLAFTHFGKARE